MWNMRRWKIPQWFLFGLIMMCLLGMFYYNLLPASGTFGQNNSPDRKLLWQEIIVENERMVNLKLRQEPDEVPIVIVDQHQEGM